MINKNSFYRDSTELSKNGKNKQTYNIEAQFIIQAHEDLFVYEYNNTLRDRKMCL